MVGTVRDMCERVHVTVITADKAMVRNISCWNDTEALWLLAEHKNYISQYPLQVSGGMCVLTNAS